MAMYGYVCCVWLCMAMYGCVWLCTAMYGYVWLCMAVYGGVWLCMAMYGCVSLCMAVYSCICPHRPVRINYSGRFMGHTWTTDQFLAHYKFLSTRRSYRKRGDLEEITQHPVRGVLTKWHPGSALMAP